MSRPKPTVILENIDKNNYKCEQILKAEAIWAVFYKGAPFNGTLYILGTPLNGALYM